MPTPSQERAHMCTLPPPPRPRSRPLQHPSPPPDPPALGIKTIEHLGKWKHDRLAKAITVLADTEVRGARGQGAGGGGGGRESVFGQALPWKHYRLAKAITVLADTEVGDPGANGGPGNQGSRCILGAPGFGVSEGEPRTRSLPGI